MATALLGTSVARFALQLSNPTRAGRQVGPASSVLRFSRARKARFAPWNHYMPNKPGAQQRPIPGEPRGHGATMLSSNMQVTAASAPQTKLHAPNQV
jgi:hypothetical protein